MEYLVSDERFLDDVAGATLALLRREPQITAIFGSNDAFAVEALRAAQAHGYRVPDELSILGFDDIELGEQTIPPLTTLAVDKVSMGRLAMQVLTHRLAWPDAATTLTTLQPRLLERQSVRARQEDADHQVRAAARVER
jgi:DNA-binding LacI/PurR family transcriptional regulator